MHKARLTIRRLEILRLIYLGYNNEQIAKEMDMGISNVKFQISRAIHYFCVRTRYEAVDVAMQQGYFKSLNHNDLN